MEFQDNGILVIFSYSGVDILRFNLCQLLSMLLAKVAFSNFKQYDIIKFGLQ